MKSRQDMLRVLLDTSFILPSLGIDVGEAVTEGFRRIVDIEAEIYYSDFSIFESLWVAARLSTSKDFDGESISLGLRSIIEGGRYTKAEVNSGAFNDSLKLYTLGHRDMVDKLLYSTSTHLNLKLLTLDKELKRFVNEKGLEDTLISPDQLTRP